MKTNPNDTIHPCTLKQTGVDDFKLASLEDHRQGLHLKPNIGLSKREYFAGLAMQGIISSDWGKKRINATESIIMLDQVSEAAVKAADALINELNKEVKP